MAFKSVKSYNEERFGGFFLLRNDEDYADVVFLYQDSDDVLVADAHYIKSADYTGYVHCCGRGCPACAKGIRTQTKLFIPVYNIAANEIQYFDRSMKFEPQLQQDVFSKYPNPSEYVFRITRHGAAGSIDTKYQIVAIGKNTFKPFGQILAEQHASMPEHYNTVCKEVSEVELRSMLNSGDGANGSYSPSEPYAATPRSYTPAPTPTVEPTAYAEPPAYVPADLPDFATTDTASTDAEEISGEPVF